MAKLDRITIHRAKMNGQPCIRNMRLTVRRVLEALALYPNREDLRREYPELEDEDIRQTLEYAAEANISSVAQLQKTQENGCIYEKTLILKALY